MSDEDQSLVRGLLSLVGALSGRFGRVRIAGIANSTDDDERFSELPERGCLRGWPAKQVMELLRSLEGAGLVEPSRGEYPTLSTTKNGDLAAIGKLDLVELGLQMPVVTKKKKAQSANRWRRSGV